MKRIIILVLLLLLTLLLTCCEDAAHKKFKYTGVVEYKERQQASSGYKSSTPAAYFLILKEKITGKYIRICVVVPTYYAAKKGDVLTFSVSNLDMYYLGNSKDYNKSFYAQ